MAVIYEYTRLALGRFSSPDIRESNELDYEIFGTGDNSVTTLISNMVPSAGLRKALNSVVIEVD